MAPPGQSQKTLSGESSNSALPKGIVFGGHPLAGGKSLHASASESDVSTYSLSEEYRQQASGEEAEDGRDGQRRGVGYRRLWQAITKLSKGQTLGDVNKMNFSDMTVEDLLKLIRNLPPEASAVDTVGQGLYYLDSRALSALLKELSKCGLGYRANELFDWLRSLDGDHELKCLCDTYTYTTMIAQCGSHQHLRRALELVAEMKTQEISCNVHTYSALMNVCIKANEFDLALDVYQQLLSEGQVPNIVTYNTLIDVYGKTGKWQEAIKVLETIEQQGLEPEVRTYNTVMIACNLNGRHLEAVEVANRMRQAGVKPTSTTYQSWITAYAKSGQLDQAVKILKEMSRKGCEKIAALYSAVLSACETPGRYEVALEVLQQMQQDGLKPSTSAYASVVSACIQGGQLSRAQQVFGHMCGVCKLDSRSCNHIMAAYCKVNAWKDALSVAQVVQAHGFKLDNRTNELLIEALCNSGTFNARSLALDLFDKASSNWSNKVLQNIKIEENSVSIVMPAEHAAVSLLFLAKLLLQLRDKTLLEGPELLKRDVIIKLGGSISKKHSGQRNTAIKRLLHGLKSPLRLVEGKVNEVHISSASEALLDWLALSTTVPALHALVTPGRDLKIDLDNVVSEDTAREIRCKAAFMSVQKSESITLQDPQCVPQYLITRRADIVALATNYTQNLALPQDVIHDAMLMMDRVLSLGLTVGEDMAPYIVSGCICLAAQQVDRAGVGPNVQTLAGLLRVHPAVLEGVKQNVLQMLQNHQSSCISAMRVLKLYLERLGCNFEDLSVISRVAGHAMDMMFHALADPAFMSFAPSVTAMAILSACRQMEGIYPYWPQALIDLTGYSSTSTTVQAAQRAAVALVNKAALGLG